MPSAEDLRKLIEECPDDPFPRYGLAMHLKSQRKADEALREFEALLARFPAYVPGHHQLALLLSAEGRVEEAREAFRRGIAVARAEGDQHAAEEMAGAMEML